MTDTSSTGADANREKHVFGWFIFPILLLFPLVALLTYDWRAMPSLCSPPMMTITALSEPPSGSARCPAKPSFLMVKSSCLIGSLQSLRLSGHAV